MTYKTRYESALKIHCEEMSQLGVEFVPFNLWLERMKRKGQFWGI